MSPADLHNAIARHDELLKSRNTSPLKPFETWGDLKDYCQLMIQQPDVETLLAHDLGNPQIVLCGDPKGEALIRRYKVTEAVSFAAMIVSGIVSMLSLNSLVFWLCLPIIAVVVWLFGQSLWQLHKTQPKKLILTQGGPVMYYNGDIFSQPDNQWIQSLEVTPDSICYTICMELVTFERRLMQQNTELEALRLVDEGYRQPNLLNVLRQIEAAAENHHGRPETD